MLALWVTSLQLRKAMATLQTRAVLASDNKSHSFLIKSITYFYFFLDNRRAQQEPTAIATSFCFLIVVMFGVFILTLIDDAMKGKKCPKRGRGNVLRSVGLESMSYRSLSCRWQLSSEIVAQPRAKGLKRVVRAATRRSVGTPTAARAHRWVTADRTFLRGKRMPKTAVTLPPPTPRYRLNAMERPLEVESNSPSLMCCLMSNVYQLQLDNKHSKALSWLLIVNLH